MNFTILIIDTTSISPIIRNIYDSISLKHTIIEISGSEILTESPAIAHLDYIIIDSDNESYILKLLHYFRKRWSYKHIPILIVSTDAIIMHTEKLSNFGVVEFLQKPIDEYLLTYSLLYTYNLCNVFRTMKGENLIFKKKLIELEKLRIRTISLAATSQKLAEMNALLELQQQQIKEQKIELVESKQKVEDLLLNILPEEVSRELMINGEANPQFYKKVTVMFTDFVGFTQVCLNKDPQEMTKELDTHFSYFDDVCEEHYLEKIKTIGDAYMCAGGIPIRNNSNPFDIILAALKIMKYMNAVNQEKIKRNEPMWQIRVGIHTGSVVAGVIGKKKFAYDIWGDAVNTAYRVQSTSEPDRINISGETYMEIRNFFDCSYRGKIYAKNKGEIDMYFLDGIRKKYADEDDVLHPNKLFNQEMAKL